MYCRVLQRHISKANRVLPTTSDNLFNLSMRNNSIFYKKLSSLDIFGHLRVESIIRMGGLRRRGKTWWLLKGSRNQFLYRPALICQMYNRKWWGLWLRWAGLSFWKCRWHKGKEGRRTKDETEQINKQANKQTNRWTSRLFGHWVKWGRNWATDWLQRTPAHTHIQLTALNTHISHSHTEQSLALSLSLFLSITLNRKKISLFISCALAQIHF